MYLSLPSAYRRIFDYKYEEKLCAIFIFFLMEKKQLLHPPRFEPMTSYFQISY
ncbi:hypothetical protein Scep_004786 [Stephania cephalantha]|uniref:Uncharacterized protein n=1 Tax=Stephania cephalantha TaxID=152367 RepID=A0AAP0PVQ9_9MAGN